MRPLPTASVPGKHLGKRCSKPAWISLYVLVFTACNLHAASLGQSLKVCDYRQSTISCPAGFALQIQTAFYGRRDTSTCSSIASTLGFPPVSWSLTTCSFANALTQAKTWCDGKPSCTIPPTGAWPSDPCVGTFKYTDVFYLCVSTSGETPLSLRLLLAVGCILADPVLDARDALVTPLVQADGDRYSHERVEQGSRLDLPSQRSTAMVD